MHGKDYHELPDEAFNSTPAPLGADFHITSTPPPPDPDFEESGGRGGRR